MIEVHPDRWMDLFPLFAQTRFGVLAAGTLNGGHPGKLFADQAQQPRVCLVCTRVGYYFLAGSPLASPSIPTEIARLINCELMPQQIAQSGDTQFILFFEPVEWKEPLLDAFAQQRPILIQKKRMILPEDCKKNWSSEQNWVPEGMRLVPVDVDLLKQHPQEATTIELFWGSVENFHQKSLGFWLFDGDTLTSTCEAVFVGAGEVELSVATSLAYRRQGLARLTASAMIDACLARGLSPIWGCWPENYPSVALAQSLGFVEDCLQDILLIEYPQPDESQGF